MVWFLMLSRVPRCLWPLGKWKMEEEAGQQHDCGVHGCCSLNSCENSGMRRWGIFLSEIQCHCYWKITHTICVFPHRIAHLTLELKLFHPFTLLLPLNVITYDIQWHTSADLFSLALCVSEASLLCAEDKTYIIHGAQMRTNLPSWEDVVQHVK